MGGVAQWQECAKVHCVTPWRVHCGGDTAARLWLRARMGCILLYDLV
jgi:hypothetical protein